MGKLLIIRHGHTSLNMPGRDERLRGWLDVPLDGEGLEEAAVTAGKVRAMHTVDAIYSSDLRRARQTAEVLRKQTKAPIIATSDLRPWNLGVFCGQRVPEILPFLNLLNQHLDLAAPSGESFYQFYGRYAHRLKELLQLAEASPNSIAVVTHVRNLLATSSVITGSDRDKVPVKGGPHTGAVVVVEKELGRWKIGAGTHEVVVFGDANVSVRVQAVA
ncbi:MAG TPA: histidine phosphatase family protein [Candidatus Eremiobacteraceae bacterium]|nr:histidine phosphatase family protein [Candidatus Eremiobacteraceae bacterium]